MARTSHPRPPIRVAAVDDHPIVVAGLASLLTRDPETVDESSSLRTERSMPAIEWMGQATSWAAFLTQLEDWGTVPDVTLFDLYLNDGSKPEEGIAELVARGSKVVVFTSEVRPVPIRRAIQAGATGLVLKSDDVEKVLDVVHAVALGHFAVSSDLAFVLATDENLVPHLAPRELEVLQLLADGVPRKSVGSRLDPPVKLATVVTYLNRIAKRYEEVGRPAKTSFDVIRAAVEDGYLDPPGSSPPS